MPEQNESLNVSAKSVEEAIEQGLAQLGLTRNQVDIEIIHEGKRGLFGLGSEDATVRLTPKSQPQTAASAAVHGSISASKPAEERAANQDDDITDASEWSQGADDNDSQPKDVAEIGTTYLTGLLTLMGIQAQVHLRLATDLVEPGEEAPLVFDIIGKDLGILIGRHNETLQSLQYMLRLMISKEVGRWLPVVVDVESYRARRRESLRKLALRMAERATTNRERVVLETMPAYERRIIHIALRDHPGVITKSIGRDKTRKVTIIPK